MAGSRTRVFFSTASGVRSGHDFSAIWNGCFALGWPSGGVGACAFNGCRMDQLRRGWRVVLVRPRSVCGRPCGGQNRVCRGPRRLVYHLRRPGPGYAGGDCRGAVFKDAVGYVVDFDTQIDFLFDYWVRVQSTLIVFSGGEEVGRAIAITSAESIRELFMLGLPAAPVVN